MKLETIQTTRNNVNLLKERKYHTPLSNSKKKTITLSLRNRKNNYKENLKG